MNKSKRKNNTSGTEGVYYENWSKKWIAEIRCNKERVRLGYHDTKSDAKDTRKYCDKWIKDFGDINNKGE